MILGQLRIGARQAKNAALLKTGNNDQEIANLAFESHSFLKIHFCLPIEQAWKNIC